MKRPSAELNGDLFCRALTESTPRPSALRHLQAYLAAGGDPNRRVNTGRMMGVGDALLTAAAAHGWTDAVVDLLAAGADVHIDNDGALRWAANNGHLSVVECLLAAGADVHAVSDLALRSSATKGHLPIIQCLLAAGADVHVGDDDALWRAARNGHRSVAAWLLSAGARADRSITEHPANDGYEVCMTLDTVAAAIPADQRPALLAMDPHRFPALRALCDAEQRRHAPTGRGRQPQP